MKKSIIESFEKRVFKNTPNLPEFRPGDTIRVHYKIQDGSDSGKERTQLFEGVVIRYKKGTADSTFTVRKIGAGGVGVERVFPAYSPNLSKVEVKAYGAVRRSRLFYLRDLSGKAARIRNKFGFADDSASTQQNDSEETKKPIVNS
jgi:large subunit ribosomal protein L19